MKIDQPTLFDATRPRFITTNTSEEFKAVMDRLKQEGHFVPTIARGNKHPGQWVIEVIYRDE